MGAVRNSRKLSIVVALCVIFALLAVFKFFYNKTSFEEQEKKFAYQQAKILNGYITEYRHYYQGLFLSSVLELDEKTLKALPAYALVPVNDKFSTSNPFFGKRKNGIR